MAHQKPMLKLLTIVIFKVVVEPVEAVSVSVVRQLTVVHERFQHPKLLVGQFGRQVEDQVE